MSPQQTAREARAGFRARTLDETLAEVECGAIALADMAHRWRTHPPSLGALTGADAVLDGLHRLVVVLRSQTQRSESV